MQLRLDEAGGCSSGSSLFKPQYGRWAIGHSQKELDSSSNKAPPNEKKT